MIFETINTIFVMIYQYNNIRNCDTFKVKTMLKNIYTVIVLVIKQTFLNFTKYF